MVMGRRLKCLLLIAVMALSGVHGVRDRTLYGVDGLSDNYYRYSCPNAESVIQTAVSTELDKNHKLAAGLIRMQFHDCFVEGGGEAFKEIEFNAKRNRLVTVQELQNFIHDLGEEEMEFVLGTQAEEREADKVRKWVRSARLVEKSLTEIEGWSCIRIGEEQVQKAWSKPVKDWLGISREKTKTFANLSRRWGRNRETEVWLWRWRSLWNSKLALRQKLWIWRILHRGLASLSRIEKWGLSDGFCMGCRSEKETLEHLLWGCSRIRNRMEWLTLTVTGEDFHASSFFDVLDTALRAQKQNLGPLLLVCEVSKQCWLERNHMVFDNTVVEISLTSLLLKVKSGKGTLLKKVKEDVRRNMQARQNEFWRRAEHVIEEIKRREEVLHDICDVIDGWSTEIGGQRSRSAEEGRNEESESSEEDSSVCGNGTGESDTRWEVQGGRKDGFHSSASQAEADLPPPEFGASELIDSFARRGLSTAQMVILSGSHTVGVADCSKIVGRFYNFNNNQMTDPSMDPAYAEQLKKDCPQNSWNTTVEVFMDTITPGSFDSNYHQVLQQKKGLFTSDQTLLNDARTSGTVNTLMENGRFQKEFGEAMRAMAAVGVKSGSQGEIRKYCRSVNY
ncbi:hypothetical protein R1sor_011915 [Riccia sorocarpa]|uniref:Plant heme peroxidase family profile domain-containing protein n=1 Tax=Riccia sorocarpa TaxID=122646 RepID=A0ABD3I469_9MARC